MRIKLLSVIVSFLLVSFAMSSCLGEEEPLEYSPNAIVQAFALDAVLGVGYNFTIDQITGQIYNLDSLPVGSDTIIDRILITKLSIAGFATIRNIANTEDSLFSIEDSVNLVGTMEKPFKFKVWAPDLQHKKEYSLSVRVHQQQPDSLDWGKDPISINFAPITGKQKAIILGNEILVYAPNNLSAVFFTQISSNPSWSSAPVVGLPSTNVTSIVNLQDLLYATVAESSKVYSSDNGRNWKEVSSLGENVITLIAPINNSAITAIRANGQELRFCKTDGNNWIEEGIVPENFPRNNISAAIFKNAIGIPSIMIVGNTESGIENDTATVAWGYSESQEWAALPTESSTYFCPKLADPSIIYYGDAFYIFGKDFKTFYKSEAGIIWKEVNKMFMFPEAIKEKESDYSMVVDKTNFIWLMRSTPNEVWRGRLNRLGFKLQ